MPLPFVAYADDQFILQAVPSGFVINTPKVCIFIDGATHIIYLQSVIIDGAGSVIGAPLVEHGPAGGSILLPPKELFELLQKMLKDNSPEWGLTGKPPLDII